MRMITLLRFAVASLALVAVTINPDEQWAKVKADTEAGGVKWDLVNVGPR